MSGTFDFCPNSLVPEMIPPDPTNGMSMNGWSFSAKPTIPFQRSWRITLHGMRWYTNAGTGLFDTTTDPTHNAARLEAFYQANGCWDTFSWTHPHISGAMTVRFKVPVQIPAALSNSGGVINPLEVTLIQHNPGF